MSIINEAIKKAKKESGIKQKSFPLISPSSSSEVKWIVAVSISLMVIVSLLGALFLYKHISGTITSYEPLDSGVQGTSLSSSSATSNKRFSGFRGKRAIELTGIVYGPQDRWAIINNDIFKEGDTLTEGKLALIAKDFVKIEKKNGEEIVLDLK